MYNQDEMSLKDHTLFIDQRKINAFAKGFKGPRNSKALYQPGDFVIHGAGYGFSALIEFLEEHRLTEV
jgi:hypothetical protein